MIFEDFSTAVKKHQDFYLVKQELKERGIVFAILYPAILGLFKESLLSVVSNPKDVTTYLEVGWQPPGTPTQVPED